MTEFTPFPGSVLDNVCKLGDWLKLKPSSERMEGTDSGVAGTYRISYDDDTSDPAGVCAFERALRYLGADISADYDLLEKRRIAYLPIDSSSPMNLISSPQTPLLLQETPDSDSSDDQNDNDKLERPQTLDKLSSLVCTFNLSSDVPNCMKAPRLELSIDFLESGFRFAPSYMNEIVPVPDLRESSNEEGIVVPHATPHPLSLLNPPQQPLCGQVSWSFFSKATLSTLFVALLLVWGTERPRATGHFDSKEENAHVRRFAEVIDCATALTGNDVLSNLNSAQAGAAFWFMKGAGRQLPVPATKSECVGDSSFASIFGLLVVRDALDVSDVSWHSDASLENEWEICHWSRLNCEERNSEVVALTLNNAHLHGTLPAELSLLKHLTHLLLPSNSNITGTIPSSIGTLTKLQVLNLVGTNIHGTIPSELGRLSALEQLILSGTPMTGTVPTEVCDLGISHGNGLKLPEGVECTCCGLDGPFDADMPPNA